MLIACKAAMSLRLSITGKRSLFFESIKDLSGVAVALDQKALFITRKATTLPRLRVIRKSGSLRRDGNTDHCERAR